MSRELSVVHHLDRRTDVVMPFAPAVAGRRGRLLVRSGLTAAPVYHSHPHPGEEFDVPPSVRAPTVLVAETLGTTLAAAGATRADLVPGIRPLTDVGERDDLDRVRGRDLGAHLPAPTTVEVSRLATHARRKVEISAIAVVRE